MAMQWIDSADRLAQFLAPLRDTGGALALDTEFARTSSYFPRLCLVQLAREDGAVALIDPLVCPLDPLVDCWRRDDLAIVLHAAFQDLEVLYQAVGALPARVFDTQIAALLHGLGDHIGLATLLETMLNVRLPKDATRTCWCQRPLSERQLAYAANDVRHLLPLYHALKRPLSDAAQAALQQDFDDLLKPERYDMPPEQAWRRIDGQQRLGAKSHTLLRALAAWRETQARAENRPRRWILSDETLMTLARRPPATLEKLRQSPSLTSEQRRRYGQALIATLDEAFAAADWQRPQSATPPDEHERIWLSVAQAVVTQQALKFRFKPGRIAAGDLLDWSRHRSGPLKRGWRHLLVGAPLADFHQGVHPLRWRPSSQELEIIHAPIFSA